METSISDQAIEWFSKLRSGHATPEDRGRFEVWRKLSPLHAKAYTDIEKFWLLLDKPARRVFEQKEARVCHQSKVGSDTREAVSRIAKRPVRRAFAGFAAAAVSMFIWLPGVLYFWTSDYHTRWGERREFALEDGSRISLNTHSALSVEFSPHQRVIRLREGEAYFRVSHNPARPFLVVTAHGVAKVTGTAFNVREQDERMTVTVSEGRVRVYTDGAEDQAAELTAGLQASGDAQGIGPVVRVDTLQAPVWREGLLVFNMQPLAAVVGELNRYLPGRLMLADPRIRERIVSGAFDLTRPEDILAAIEKTLGLSSLNLSSALTILYQPSL
ncbi:MAG: FecR family protein [Methylococcales bacterium]